ncbi:MAG: TrkH family potassium uptake protein [Lachnospiraceae bacterium]|nr:TrkH family potassium uptake protein [Lachnospiraceae bacterium]MBR1568826.1 TrkH family potassium uptake protein [Lachnospiraceae bacterium]
MNYQILRYILGLILIFEAIFLLLPGIVAAIYGEPCGWWFLVTAAVVVLIGFALRIKKPTNMQFHGREGLVLVSMSWILISLISAFPMTISGIVPNYVDALFEMVSGFTTTGASALTTVEHLPHCINFWRCFSNWIGGMGVIVFIMMIIPKTASNANMYLMRAESPGPSFGKLVPKLKSTARTLYLMYIGLTLVQLILLLFGGVSFFEALCISMATAGTGGFGIRDTGFSLYSSYVQIVVTVFMFLFGVNFKFYFLLIMRKIKDAFAIEEVFWYTILFAVASILIAVDIYPIAGTIGGSLKHASFQVATVMTTTGFATMDFNAWPIFSQVLLVLLMFVGACAGSTGGGMKVSRFIIYIKSALKEMATLLHPNSVKKIKMDGKVIDHETIRSANIYLIIYVLVMALSIIIVSLDQFDLVTTVTSVIATFNNIGPGLGAVGPAGNFHSLSILSKLVLIFDMLTGRLEIFPIVILFVRDTWKK